MTISKLFEVRRPTPWVLEVPKGYPSTNPELIMGMELEIEGCPSSDGWYAKRLNPLGWTVTTDNSLRGNNVNTNGNLVEGNAFEFISRPMAAQTLAFSLEEFFKVTSFNEKNYSDRTSVHIHANCTDLSVEQVSTLALAYTVAEDILFRFVGENRENNIYCIPWNQCRMNYDIVQKMADHPNETVRRWQKYTALNLLPLQEHGTVEFRHMNGTPDLKKLHTWINLIGSLFAFATKTELTALIEEIKRLNSTSEYESFFHRVLGDNLPYTDEYRASLESGVLSAKYSLINWKRANKIGLSGGTTVNFEEQLEAMAAAPVRRAGARRSLAEMQAAAVAEGARNPLAQAFRQPPAAPMWGQPAPAEAPTRPPETNRVNPWPLTGHRVWLSDRHAQGRQLNDAENRTLLETANRLGNSYRVRTDPVFGMYLDIIAQPPANSTMLTVANLMMQDEHHEEPEVDTDF